MNIEQKKKDIDYGLFILEQYKLRRELGLLKFNGSNVVNSICSKYSNIDLLFDAQRSVEHGVESTTSGQNEFGRVLNELTRREELIQELLAKLERYESTSNNSETHNFYLENKPLCKCEDSEHIVGRKLGEIRSQKSEFTNEHLCLWKSLLNSSLMNDIVKYNECNRTQESSDKWKCEHELLLEIYRNETKILIEENDKLKMCLGIN